MSGGRQSYTVKGGLVADLRNAKFMSQDELASQVGVSEAAIRRIESGRTPYSHRSTVRKLAEALGVSVEALIEFEDPDLPDKLRSLATA